MQIPGLGAVVEDAELGWYRSAPLPVPVLGGTPRQIVVDGYDDDPAQEDFHDAIRSFLSLGRSALDKAARSIFAYYCDVMSDVLADGDDEWYVHIDDPSSVLEYVRFGDEPIVSRDPSGDQRVYVSIECECAWEPEHGLQIVFRDGAEVTKVGPYDGHLTNSAAFADDTLDGVVYRSR
ncbi:hypothetical protein JQS43_08080 [Natronosporangium hydrolyticum]|uniref:DUF6985 domain-containing protein n=1 Tax=Natronosporangium hydrolyticum TaxID=2811111 RepID=A0A895YQ42_9ACTN|nr:hypothetical protein [Natronosporangium hydrolyticum]QSB16240.1 hypothetical protein JQS43_08080 [Natronosporangium hydrolyticum]